MNKKRIREESKVGAQTILSCKQNSDSQLVVKDHLSGIDDIAQFDSSGVPFILVDGICVRTRHQLHMALTKREEKGMRRVQRQCCVLPWLEYTRPALETEPVTIEEKEAQEELDFQTDLQLLQLRVEDKSLASEVTGLNTLIAHSAGTDDLPPNFSRIKEIRTQLEKLREQQRDDPLNRLVLSKELRIRRQATFDIERNVSSSRIECRPSFKKMDSSRSKECPLETFKAPYAPLVNRIGDLLMKIPENRLKSEIKSLSNGSYACVVAVAPNLDDKRCNVEPDREKSKASALTFPIASRCVPEKYKRDSTIATITAPLQTKSQSFLKVPTLVKAVKK